MNSGPMTIEAVGEVLACIYDSEIPIRLEWIYDGGFTWSLIDTSRRDSYPRVWNDDSLDGSGETIIQSDDGARASDAGQFLRKDWIARGSESTIQDAVARLADAILEAYPESDFSKAWKSAIESKGLSTNTTLGTQDPSSQ